MVNSKFIHVRITAQQLEAIKNAAYIENKTMANYIRNILLYKSPDVQQRLIKMNDMIVKIYELQKQMSTEKCQMKKDVPNGKESSEA